MINMMTNHGDQRAGSEADYPPGRLKSEQDRGGHGSISNTNGQLVSGRTGSEPANCVGRLGVGVVESARLLGISEKSVRRLGDRGLLRASRALRQLMSQKKDIEVFLDRTSST